jgi:hypothetical protein
MTAALSAAIDRLIARRASGHKGHRRARVHLRLAGSLGSTDAEKRGRNKAHLGRVARFDEK